MVKLDVPGIVTRQTNVWLFCEYDIEKDKLYSVKWYKNRVEFYRYLPSDSPPGQTYELPGLSVDLDQSNGSHVLLRNVDFETEGNYRCEISAEAPSFQTITAEKALHVYHLPTGGPQIVGLEGQYGEGEYLNLTCSTEPSKPRAKLEWLLNGKKVHEAYQRHKLTSVQPGGHMSQSEVQLVKLLNAKHFPRGVVTVTCLASLEQLDSSCSRELIIPDTSQWSPSYQSSEAAPGQIPPVITGDVRRYDTGDHVTINCTSANPTPTKLKWLLNEESANPSELVEYEDNVVENGSSATTLGFHFRLLPKHFKNHEVRLRCDATTFKVVHLSNEAIVERSPQLHTELQQQSGESSLEVRSGNINHQSSPETQPILVLLTSLCYSLLR